MTSARLQKKFVLAPTLPVTDPQVYLSILAYLRNLALGWVADTLYVLSPDPTSAEVQRSHLAPDTRSLLSTPEFQEYVERFLTQDIWENSQLRPVKWTEPDPSTWLMTLLEFPVKLKTFDNAPGIPHEMAMNVEFGQWNTGLRILLVTREDDKPNYPNAQNIGQQWLNVSTCLQREIESLID